MIMVLYILTNSRAKVIKIIHNAKYLMQIFFAPQSITA